MNTIKREDIDQWCINNGSLFFTTHKFLELNDYMRYIQVADHNFYQTIHLNIPDLYSDQVTHISYMSELETYGDRYNEDIDPDVWKNWFWANVISMANSNQVLNDQFSTALGMQLDHTTPVKQEDKIVTNVEEDKSTNITPKKIVMSSEFDKSSPNILMIRMFNFNDNFKFSNTTILSKGDTIVAIGEDVYVKNSEKKFVLSDLSLFMVLNNSDKFIEQEI